jgi:tripeptide aminopeptidase
VLGKALVEEMLSMGIADAHMDEHGYVYGTVPGHPGLPTVGLIAHMDTSPDCSDENVKARVISYEGGDICLNEEKEIYLRSADYESLNANVGKHLVVTDGTTLLGADDKAGIAEILTAAEHLLKTKAVHGTLKIAFTPDEEIGRGADLFDVKGFDADYAYTVDGGALGELEYENFNAAAAKVTFKGLNIHPGSAKNKMVNAQLIAMEFQGMLPVHQRPEATEGYEGFILLTDMEGEVENAQLKYILRDHDAAKLEYKKETLRHIADCLNGKYGEGTVAVTIKDSYQNMAEMIKPHFHLVETASQAIRMVGLEPELVPVRGGTDGARLSWMGLPCPNLGTGGFNFHGTAECITAERMDKAVEILLNIVQLYAK